MTIELTPALVARYIPNVILEVEGEQPLVEKLVPFFRSAAGRMSLDTGDIDYMADEHKDILVHACVKEAFSDAVPSLDLVLTPTGFGVVSTTDIAPASKERIQRLVDSLRHDAAELFIRFIDICRTYPEWRQSFHGRQLCSTFLTSLRDVERFMPSSDIPQPRFSEYTSMHRRISAIAARFERTLADNYLGFPLMKALLDGYCSGQYDASHPLVSMIREADFRYVAAHLDGDQYRCPDPHETWHAAAPMISALKQFPELYKLWDDTMGEKFKPAPFKNTTPGGFFF